MADVKKCKIENAKIISTEFGACKEAFNKCKKTEDAVGPAALKCCEGTSTTPSPRFRRKWSFNRLKL